MNNKPQILLTNDDGIDSPGLWAAAEALSEIGYVWVIAPREQSSGMGRSTPNTSDGIITPKKLTVHGKEWTIFAVGGSPAQAVQHGILEIIQEKPDLIVSGINYGLNLGTAVTISGTIGATLEGAEHGIPSLAISLETAKEYHLSHSSDIDFTAASHFTKYFGQRLISGRFDPRVQIIKVDIPSDASCDTPWTITRLSTHPYYIPIQGPRADWNQPALLDYTIEEDIEKFEKGSDVYAVIGKRLVSITPLTLDMTAPVDFIELESQLKN